MEIEPREMNTYIDPKICIQILTAALFMMVKKEGTAQMFTNWWMNQEKVVYYLTIKKNADILQHGWNLKKC